MKQTTKTLLTMGGLALVALAIAFVAAWAGKDEETKAAAKEQSAKLISIDKAAVRDVKIVKAGRLVVEVLRKDDKSPWQVVAPVHTDADEPAVNGLVDKLTTLTQKTQVEGVEARQVGIADETSARLAVTVSDGANKSETIAFGDENAFDQTVYTRKTGETALRLVPRADRGALEKELIDLRDKRVFHIDESAQLSKLEVVPEGTVLGSPLANSAGQFAFELDRDGTAWKLVKPQSVLADSTQVDRMLTSVKNLRAKDAVADSTERAVLSQYGLGAPKLTVTVTGTGLDGKTFERKVIIGQTAPIGAAVAMKSYAQRDDSPAIFEIDGSILRDLGHSLFELEDKSLLTVPRESVAKIEIATPGQPSLVITRTASKLLDGGAGEDVYAIAEPKQGPARKYKMAGILSSYTLLKAVAPGEPRPGDPKGLAKFGLDHPRIVSLYDAGGGRLAKIEVGGEAEDKKHVYVWIDGKTEISQIDASLANDLPKNVDEALEPPPAEMPGQKKQ